MLAAYWLYTRANDITPLAAVQHLIAFMGSSSAGMLVYALAYMLRPVLFFPAALLPLAAPARPEPDVPCGCGHLARYVRVRPATVTTVLGRIAVERAISYCPCCGAYHTPLDQQLQIAASGISLGLQELLALLGATQDSFAQAASVLERLCLVHLCPNSVRAATEDLGAVLADHERAVVTTARTDGSSPPAAAAAPPRVYLSMDGVVAHVHDAG